MKRFALAAVLLVSLNAFAAPKSHDVFGTQLDCATSGALNNYGPSMSESSRVRRAVDKCISSWLAEEPRIIRASNRQALTTLPALQVRREDLVEATMNRLQLCRDTGVAANACPRLFTLQN